MPLIYGQADLTWQSALILAHTGERIAIVGHFDADTVQRTGVYSTEEVIGALRGRKTPGEVERIKAAIETTRQIYQRTFDYIQVGMTERQISDFMHAQLDEFGVQAGWSYSGCPVVNTGPDSPIGHAEPTDLRVARGQIVHFDFGVRQDEYCYTQPTKRLLTS